MSALNRQSDAQLHGRNQLTLDTVDKGTRQDTSELLDDSILRRLQRRESARSEATQRARVALLLYRFRVTVASLDERLRRRPRERCDDVSDRFLDLLDEGEFRRW